MQKEKCSEKKKKKASQSIASNGRDDSIILENYIVSFYI